MLNYTGIITKEKKPFYRRGKEDMETRLCAFL
jgi:hypothetical protein